MRPKKCRIIQNKIENTFFKPRGIPMRDLDIVVLEPDEVEALRLAFSENLYQEQAALEMKISRATFGRILNLACQKVTDALLHSKAIQLNNNDNQ